MVSLRKALVNPYFQCCLESLHSPCQQAVGRLYIKVTVCQFGTRLQLALASQMSATVNHGTIFPQYAMQNAKSCLGSLGLLVLLLLLTHSLDVTGCKRKSSCHVHSYLKCEVSFTNYGLKALIKNGRL